MLRSNRPSSGSSWSWYSGFCVLTRSRRSYPCHVLTCAAEPETHGMDAGCSVIWAAAWPVPQRWFIALRRAPYQSQLDSAPLRLRPSPSLAIASSRCSQQDAVARAPRPVRAPTHPHRTVLSSHTARPPARARMRTGSMAVGDSGDFCRCRPPVGGTRPYRRSAPAAPTVSVTMPPGNPGSVRRASCRAGGDGHEQPDPAMACGGAPGDPCSGSIANCTRRATGRWRRCRHAQVDGAIQERTRFSRRSGDDLATAGHRRPRKGVPLRPPSVAPSMAKKSQAARLTA